MNKTSSGASTTHTKPSHSTSAATSTEKFYGRSDDSNGRDCEDTDEDKENEAETHVLEENKGPSGMAFTVKSKSPPSIPAPAPSVSNAQVYGLPTKPMTFDEFLNGVGGNIQADDKQPKGHSNDDKDDDDFIISSSDSSAEDD